MAFLKWITDKALEDAVRNLLDVTKSALQNANDTYYRNVIDPFSAVFQVAGFGIDFKTWEVSEKTRQAQKTMQNHVGTFHQTVLGSVKGWQDLGVGQGVDLVCHSKKIIAEVKNKYNTVTGGKLSDQYYDLEKLVTPKASSYKDYTAYFVNIIPANPARYDKTFEPSDRSKGMKCPQNGLIRTIDGASFYSLVTGDPHALEQLFLCLPIVIKKTSGSSISQSDIKQLNVLFNKAY